MSKQNKHISEEAMQRYLNGEMDAAEQHALEQQLENDPFAYAAMEGLEELRHTEVARELQKLQMEATEVDQSLGWMRIAAAATIALMAGLGIWYFGKTDPPAQIAYEEAPVIEKRQQAPTTSEPVNGIPETTAEAMAEVPEEENKETQPDEPAGSEVSALAETERIDAPLQKPAEELPTLRNEVAVTLGENRTRQDEEIVLEETVAEDMVFEEQVAQDFDRASGASADQQLSRAAPAAKSMARQSFSANTPQPVDGLKAYQDYLTDSLRYTPEMEVGIVTLRFTISQDGTPVDIQIINGLNEPADAEAIRLVREGPKWSGSVGVPTTLSVPVRPE
ncbi:MAG: hypothetical protein RIC80_01860 [Cyclobacteriaceae bacterium]